MVLFYTIDYSNAVDEHTICRNKLKLVENVYKNDALEKNITRKMKIIHIDSIELNRFLLDLHYYIAYRLKVANGIASFCGRHEIFVIKIHPPEKEPLDYAWGYRANVMMWEQIEVDEMMSWLSTLGGAFSALGDYKLSYANIAGRISLRQMKLALRLGDPSLIARCRLYQAIAMIQSYNFTGAKYTIQQVYRAEKRRSEPDSKLIKMCLGIWTKLSYEYELYEKKLNRSKE
ncbi:uncharacterized protein F58A4.6 [Toxorhynchites rutilus septentrionalis]|uniref:uncharacterized protein F58A4.6 n=1 Tax=Toxorhynchites rutilus septentrionalis TaxID=329112 RepID=UPI00247A95B8|nr:uncharacterized protein F58A4.6 [Toxorhynchites rutilus septentrionalis]